MFHFFHFQKTRATIKIPVYLKFFENPLWILDHNFLSPENFVVRFSKKTKTILCVSKMSHSHESKSPVINMYSVSRQDMKCLFIFWYAMSFASPFRPYVVAVETKRNLMANTNPHTHTHIKSLIFHHSAFVIVFTKLAACGENFPEKKLLFFVSFLWNVLLSFLLQEVCLYHTQTHNCCFSIFQQLLIIRHTYEMPPCYLVREELLDSFTGIRNCEKISIYILGIFELTKREKSHVFWEC